MKFRFIASVYKQRIEAKTIGFSHKNPHTHTHFACRYLYEIWWAITKSVSTHTLYFGCSAIVLNTHRLAVCNYNLIELNIQWDIYIGPATSMLVCRIMCLLFTPVKLKIMLCHAKPPPSPTSITIQFTYQIYCFRLTRRI